MCHSKKKESLKRWVFSNRLNKRRSAEQWTFAGKAVPNPRVGDGESTVAEGRAFRRWNDQFGCGSGTKSARPDIWFSVGMSEQNHGDRGTPAHTMSSQDRIMHMSGGNNNFWVGLKFSFLQFHAPD